MPFHRKIRHQCTLDLGSDSMLPKKDGKRSFCHNFHKLNLIAVAHPESECFVSYPEIVAERQRQLFEGGPWLIHPFSWLSLIWRSFMTPINLAFMIIAPMRFCYVFPSDPPVLSVMDHILLSLQIPVFVDIIFTFNMGYKDNKNGTIVMVWSRIACRYLITWFSVDLITCLPLGYIIPWIQVEYKYQMFFHVMPCIRCVRLWTVEEDLDVLIKALKGSFMAKRIIKHAVILFITMHWCSCLLYLGAIFQFYWTGKSPENYCEFLEQEHGDITLASMQHRYEKGILIACAAFFGTGYTLFNSINPEEIIINACIILYGSVFMVYTMVLLLKIYMTLFNTTMRYEELMNQTEKYMRHRQFPMQMKNRVRTFYNYRYQERYFKEYACMDCLSEQLRNEITLDTCHKLIDKVSLFEGVPPSVVGTVLGCLKPEVYMPNDLVVLAGDEGDCMYFIATGTVAVFSLKGSEVCHLEDGAHFGEVALLMKDRKRVATVVAIEITLVYRLDESDFREFIMSFQNLYERVEILASKRMHETVLIDEAKHAYRSSF